MPTIHFGPTPHAQHPEAASSINAIFPTLGTTTRSARALHAPIDTHLPAPASTAHLLASLRHRGQSLKNQTHPKPIQYQAALTSDIYSSHNANSQTHFIRKVEHLPHIGIAASPLDAALSPIHPVSVFADTPGVEAARFGNSVGTGALRVSESVVSQCSRCVVV